VDFRAGGKDRQSHDVQEKVQEKDGRVAGSIVRGKLREDKEGNLDKVVDKGEAERGEFKISWGENGGGRRNWGMGAP